MDKSFYRLGLDVSLVVPSGGPSRDVRNVLQELKTNNQTTQYLQNGDSVKVLQTNRFYIPFDKAKMAAKGLYPQELVDEEEGRVEFEININQNYGYEQLIRNELMLLDILGTNAFERPIYVMNPRYLKKVFPNIEEYVRQEGLVHRIVPYKASGSHQTERSYDLMKNKFQWGGVNNPDVYLEEAVSVNNSRNMRQFHVLLADNLIRNGEKGKALDILNKAVVEFPNSKIPYDRYDIMLAENYFKAGNTAKAKEVLNEIIDYYTEYLNYYNRFTGRKARSVEGEKQLSLLTLSEILSIAERYGMQQEAAKLKQIPEVAQINRANQVGRLLNDYIERLNAGANVAQQGNTAKAEELFVGLIEDIKANLLNSGNDEIDNQVGSMLAYIVSVSNKLGLSSVIEKIQNDAQLLSMAKQASEIIAAQQ